MRTVAMAGRSEVRRRWAGILAVAVAAALGLGAALGAFIAAYRTDHAYPDHVQRARMADLVINPSLTSIDADRVIRSLPHVRHVATYGLMYAGYADPEQQSYTLGALQADNTGNLYASTDGQYLATDRVIARDGAPPTGPREVFVTDEYRAELTRAVGHRLAVGERIPIGFLWAGVNVIGADPSEVVHPLGVEQLRISGFGRLADEVLDDPLYPHEELIVSPDVARRFMCAPPAIPATSDLDELLPAVFPPNCSILYRYYALSLDDPANVAAVGKIAHRRLTALDGPLRDRIGKAADQISYYPIITTRRDADARVRHAVRPIVVALDIFGWVALAATLVVIALAAGRLMRDENDTDDVLRALGAGRGARLGVRVLPAALGGVVGAAGALVVGFLLSPVGPVGEVARVSASRSFAAPGVVVALFVAGSVLALILVIGAAALVATRHHEGRPRLARADGIRRAVRPEIADGVTAALAGGRAVLLPGAAAVAIAAVVVTVIFGTNLGGVIGTPQRYGWPWQAGVVTGSGYGETRTAVVRATLTGRSGVRSWDSLGIESGSVAGRPTPLLIATRSIDVPVVSGRAPRRAGEAVLGRATAERLGLAVGDRVRIDTGVSAGGHSVRARVVGTAVLPAIGQFLSDRTGLGVGAFLLVPPRVLRQDTSFTGIHLAPGADPARFVASIHRRIQSWDGSGSPPYTFVAPVRPSEIVNADAMRTAPALLAGVLALALLVALAPSIGATVNARHRAYAIYRAIGFRRAQVGRSVRWQALTTMVAGIAIGVPVGIVGGRVLWSRFAEQLGIASTVDLPVAALLLVVVGALVAALLAAVGPARRAGRRSPADTLAGP
jgi:hypothetical protein